MGVVVVVVVVFVDFFVFLNHRERGRSNGTRRSRGDGGSIWRNVLR